MRASCFHGPKPGARRGAIMVFMVAGIVMLLAMVMISVDVASMQLVRSELRAATDAAAKAGAEALLRTQSKSEAVKAAMSFAELNNVGSKPFKIAAQDVVVGTSIVQTDGSWAFTTGGTKPNAVRINSHMDNGSASGPITLAFAKAFKAGTFTPTKSSTASAMEQEVALVIDRSSSMAFNLAGVDWVYPKGGRQEERPKKGSRWDSLLTAVEIYLDEVSETPVPSRVALVTWGSQISSSVPAGLTPAPEDDDDIDFSNKDKVKGKGKGKGKKKGHSKNGTMLPPVVASTDVELTYDYEEIGDKLVQRTEFPIIGSTNMSAGIDEGVDVLTSKSVRPYAQKVMILMSDGQWNEGRHPRDAAEDARDRGVMIHVVTFLPEAKSSDAAAVASITGGKYFHANNEAELIAAFEKIARTLPVVLTE